MAKKKRRAQQKVARRRSAVRRYDLKKVALACAPVLLALVVIATLTWDIRSYVSKSPRFSVETIEVVGNRQLTRAELLNAAAVAEGQSSFDVRPGSVQRALEKLPRVHSARIGLDYPSRVNITVSERWPIALIDLGKMYEIDGERVLIAPYRVGVSPEGPIISGISRPGEWRCGDTVAEPGVAKAISLWRTFQPGPLADVLKVSEIDVSDPRNLVMTLARRSYVIRWGDADWKEKLERLVTLWAQTDGLTGSREPKAYIDLRYALPMTDGSRGSIPTL
jgi:cell division septal protein FtsQ